MEREHAEERLCSTVEDVKYHRGISSVLLGERPSELWRDTISTVKDVEFCRGISSVLLEETIRAVERYHQYCEGY